MSPITNKWYKLDNAAKIYPASVSKNSTNTFRVSVYLKDVVQPNRLQEAVTSALADFPTMAVTMKSGLFWHYLQPNNQPPIVREEHERPCRRIDANMENGYHFKVVYYKNKIALETFHVLTDGTGAMAFLKTILGYYLNIPVAKPSNMDATVEDSFKKYYRPSASVANRPKTPKATQLAEEALPIEGVLANHGIINPDALKKAASTRGVKITAYLTAQYILAMYMHKASFKDLSKPIVISVPINLRKRFPSVSVRNFSYFTNIRVPMNRPQNFHTIVKTVGDQLNAGTDPDVLYSQIHSNVKIESNPLFRVIPNVVKDGIMILVKKLMSGDTYTSNFSNLGVIEVPDAMKQHIEFFEFLLNAASPYKINLAACCFEDQLVISVARRVADKAIVKTFFELIEADTGVKINRYSNDEMEG